MQYFIIIYQVVEVLFAFLLTGSERTDGLTPSADPEDGTGGPEDPEVGDRGSGPPPPWKITSYMVFYRE